MRSLRCDFGFLSSSGPPWKGPAEVRAIFGTADFLAGNRVVFDTKGNSYRLVVQFKYAPLFLAFIRFIGTHAEYDRIDAAKV